MTLTSYTPLKDYTISKKLFGSNVTFDCACTAKVTSKLTLFKDQANKPYQGTTCPQCREVFVLFDPKGNAVRKAL